MARILLCNQHYWPDLASTGQHLTDLAEHLAARGHEVVVVCARSRTAGGRPTARREVRGGVEIQRVGPAGHAGLPRAGLIGRVLDYAGFHLAAARRILGARRFDVVVTLTTPPLLGLWGTLSRRLGGPPHVAFLMDHHPDAEFELGLIGRRSALGRLFEGLYGWTLRGADRCVSLGPWQAERTARRGVDPARNRVIPIWTRKEDVEPCQHAQNPLRRELGFEGRFVVLYSGNAGRVHAFDELGEAMEICAREAPDILFAFVGGGPRTSQVRHDATRRGLDNVVFQGYLPRASLRWSLCAADAHFLSLRPEQAGVSVPSKLYGQLASGRPVVFLGPRACETAADLLASGAGPVVEPGPNAGRELANALLALRRDPERARQRGLCGRAWYLAHRERGQCCEAWNELLEGVCGAPAEALPRREAA